MIQDHYVKVNMADLNVMHQTGSLITIGLGSCVGITLYDPKIKVAGLAHVMLPTSEISIGKTINVAKYADTAIIAMIDRMKQLGASINRMEAKMAGGAQMFAIANQSDVMRIGSRNVESCKLMLQRFKIKLIAEDTGGNYGRTIEINCETGVLVIRSILHGIKEM